MKSRFDVLSLTPEAAARVREIVENSEAGSGGLRIGVKNGGCAGMSYTMDIAVEPEAGDEVVTAEGATVYVDPKAVLFLLGTELDYEVTKLRSGFVFNNPNQTSACGCGESVALTAADPTALQH
ncbi:Fe-S cluster assembly scaffold SufA [Rhodobium orientis]|uniref:Fe-S cluster assembly scaffold SufA n=1 Tax=Rhodobium orientis TaxID=34017 RepID=A0A327JRS9_9HYPH|nr:Fe-S cluster assembly scaffold SufA [Rhodobium orientis]MBK5951511.1 Fe-S cluster assembly scaffold SufA [Rhodobium orientis]RAI29200.1 Fe-S cluster assembly scaffold SufA [Rhodobium orientis]